MRNARILARVSLTALAAASISVFASANAEADALLSGKVVSAAGDKMGGVTVSAKAAGSTIRTSVFTDENGEYYFPPLPNGAYHVTAQAVTFGTGKSDVDLTSNKQDEFQLCRPSLSPITSNNCRGVTSCRRCPRATTKKSGCSGSCITIARDAIRRVSRCSTGSTRRAGPRFST